LRELSFQNPHFVKALESSSNLIAGCGRTGDSKDTTSLLQSFGLHQQLSLNQSSKKGSTKILIQDSYQLSKVDQSSHNYEEEEEEEEETLELEDLEGLTFQDYVKEEDCYLKYQLPLSHDPNCSKGEQKASDCNMRTQETNVKTSQANTNKLQERESQETLDKHGDDSELLDVKKVVFSGQS